MSRTTRPGVAGASAATRARTLHGAGRRARLILRGVLTTAMFILAWAAFGNPLVAVILAALTAAADTIRVAKSWNDAAAWRKGAVGERRTARMLRPLERHGYTVLHDRSLPRSRANVDHLVIGPCGVVVVDTKNWGKSTRIVGQRFRGSRGKVWINGRPAVKRLGGILHETRSVTALLAAEHGGQLGAVTPVVAVHGARRMRWGHLTVEGVTLLYAPRLRRWIRQLPTVCADPAPVAATCARLFPPYAEQGAPTHGI